MAAGLSAVARRRGEGREHDHQGHGVLKLTTTARTTNWQATKNVADDEEDGVVVAALAHPRHQPDRAAQDLRQPGLVAALTATRLSPVAL